MTQPNPNAGSCQECWFACRTRPEPGHMGCWRPGAKHLLAHEERAAHCKGNHYFSHYRAIEECGGNTARVLEVQREQERQA